MKIRRKTALVLPALETLFGGGAGVRTQDRAAVLAYLRSINNAPAPTDAEIAKEKADLGGADTSPPAAGAK